MRAGKAYISSLGTTGVLIASSLMLLTVVGALVTFDRWPTQAAGEPETVAIAPERRDARPARLARAAAEAALPIDARMIVRAGAAADTPVALTRTTPNVAVTDAGAATAQLPAPSPVVRPPAAAPPAPPASAAQEAPSSAPAPTSPAPAPAAPVDDLPLVPQIVENDDLAPVTGEWDDATVLLSPAPAPAAQETETPVKGVLDGLLGDD